jgi:hypothetical protein
MIDTKLHSHQTNSTNQKTMTEHKQNNTTMHSATFERLGTIGIPLTVDTTTEITTLKNCVHDWFHRHLRSTLGVGGRAIRRKLLANRVGKTVSDRTKNADLEYETGRDTWCALAEETRASIIARLDLRTTTGHDLVHDNTLKKKAFDKLAYGKFLIKSIRYALNGSQALTMGPSMGKAWTASGFGIFAHLHPAVGLQQVFDVQKAVYESTGIKLFVRGLPHWLYKPTNSSTGSLPCHHDGTRSQEMFTQLVENVRSSPFKPNTVWATAHSLQTLVHLDGGTSVSAKSGKSSGGTYSLQHMNPRRMLIAMALVHPHHVHDDLIGPTGRNIVPSSGFTDIYPHYVEHDSHKWVPFVYADGSNTGPVFFPWNKPSNIIVLNRIIDLLENKDVRSGTTTSDTKWLSSFLLHDKDVFDVIVNCTSPRIHKTVTCGTITNTTNPQKSQFVACWPLQWFHGARKSNGSSRISMISVLGPTPIESRHEYFLERIVHLATIAHSVDSDARKASDVWLRRNTKALAGGSGHKRTITEIELIGKDNNGAFRCLAPTVDQALEFCKRVRYEQSSGEPWCCRRDRQQGTKRIFVEI